MKTKVRPDFYKGYLKPNFVESIKDMKLLASYNNSAAEFMCHAIYFLQNSFRAESSISPEDAISMILSNCINQSKVNFERIL